MRVFVAFELDCGIQSKLNQVKSKVVQASSKGNFTTPDNLHLTLRFIGEISAATESQSDHPTLDSLIHIVTALSETTLPLTFTLDGLGYFQKKNRKIIWVGVTEGLDELKKLAETLEAKLTAGGFTSAELPFAAHVTLGRNIELSRPFDELASQIECQHQLPVTMTANEIAIMESVQVEGRLCYRPIFKCPLKKDPGISFPESC